MTDTTAAGGDAGATTTTTEAPIVDTPIIDLDAPVEPQADPEADGEPTDKAGEDAGEDGKPKKPSGAQRAKIREQRLLDEISARERRIEELERQAPAAKAGEGEAKPPREEDFNGDYFAWQRALTAFEAGKAASEAIAKQFKSREDSERSVKEAAIASERHIAHLERVEDAREVIADFDSVMEGMKGVNVRDDVINEIKSSDSSAVIAYHLAKNPDKLYAMDRMSPRELAREMGRLEATVKLPEAKRATSAPPPLSRVTGAAAPASQESSLNAWLKKTYG